MREAVIVATARTPIGRAVKGSLKEERADDLAGFISSELTAKVRQVRGADVEDVICGVANATASGTVTSVDWPDSRPDCWTP